jgi:hypothetical protein
MESQTQIELFSKVLELLHKLVKLSETCSDDQKRAKGLDWEKSCLLDRSCVPSFTKHFHPNTIPDFHQTSVMTAVAEVLDEQQVSKSDFCRLIFLNERLSLMAELPQQIIAAFLGISEALVSRFRSQVHEDGRTRLNPISDRPRLLPPDHEQQIIEWLHLQTSVQH